MLPSNGSQVANARRAHIATVLLLASLQRWSSLRVCHHGVPTTSRRRRLVVVTPAEKLKEGSKQDER